MSDDTKAAPSLAEYIEGIGVSYPLSDVGSVLYAHRDKLAADLRAVKAVRALLAPYDGGEPWTTTSTDCDHESCERLAAVQALLEGER